MKVKTLIILIFLFWRISPAFGNIALHADVQTMPLEKRQGLFANILLSNTGNEDAFDVRVILDWGYQPRTVGEIPYIGFGETLKWTHDLKYEIKNEKAGQKGQYPLFILIRYKDINKYAFSSVDVVSVQLGDTSPQIRKSLKLELTSDDVNSMQAKLMFENPLPGKISGTCRLHAPDELSPENPVSNFLMNESESKTFIFNLNNRGALPESRYELFSVIRFDDATGSHQMQIASGTVIIPTLDDTGSLSLQITGCVVLLAALFFIVFYIELKKAQRA